MNIAFLQAAPVLVDYICLNTPSSRCSLVRTGDTLTLSSNPKEHLREKEICQFVEAMLLQDLEKRDLELLKYTIKVTTVNIGKRIRDVSLEAVKKRIKEEIVKRTDCFTKILESSKEVLLTHLPSYLDKKTKQALAPTCRLVVEAIRKPALLEIEQQTQFIDHLLFDLHCSLEENQISSQPPESATSSNPDDLFDVQLKELANLKQDPHFQKYNLSLAIRRNYVERKIYTILGKSLKFNKALQNNKAFMHLAIKQNSEVFQYASDALKADKDFILGIVKEDGLVLKYVSDEFQNNKEILLAAVKHSGYALEFASNELQADREIILTAVKKDGDAFQYASDELKADKTFVLEAVQQNGDALAYASDELQNNKEVVLAAVKQYGQALAYASNELKADREVVLEAIKEDAEALTYASDELQIDIGFVLAAVKQNGLTLQYTSAALKADKEIALAAIEQNGLALRFASPALKADKKIVLAAIKQNGIALRFASTALKNNKMMIVASRYFQR